MHVINPQMGQTVQRKRPKRFRRKRTKPGGRTGPERPGPADYLARMTSVTQRDG